MEWYLLKIKKKYYQELVNLRLPNLKMKSLFIQTCTHMRVVPKHCCFVIREEDHSELLKFFGCIWACAARETEHLVQCGHLEVWAKLYGVNGCVWLEWDSLSRICLTCCFTLCACAGLMFFWIDATPPPALSHSTAHTMTSLSGESALSSIHPQCKHKVWRQFYVI